VLTGEPLLPRHEDALAELAAAARRHDRNGRRASRPLAPVGGQRPEDAGELAGPGRREAT
ncbi:hypothetical protein ACFU99_22930, partial [Streptomyces sp. NPDC057654]|uniref:hypothetical protein n=1 Tax=Streptomyces sp. NPDC057654 TaxID=3346196 RepID=UPI00367D35B0